MNVTSQQMYARLKRLFLMSAIALCLLISWGLPAPANDAAIDEIEHEQNGVLVGLNAEQSIPIYLRPAPNQPTVGYGVSGNPIVVLEQVGDYLAFDDPQATWCHIRVEVEPYLEGWTQAKFLSLDSSNIEP